MIKTIYLHIGVHKTASTTIQNIAAANLEVLKTNGYLFPEFMIGDIPFSNHTLPLVILFHPDPKTYQMKHRITKIVSANDFRLSFRAQLQKQLNEFNGDKLIISAEGISLFDKHQTKCLKKFLIDLTNNDVVFKVILFCRHPISRLESYIQQVVKQGVLTIEDAVEGIFSKNTFFYQNIVSTFSDVFSSENISVIRFEDAVKHPHGPAAAFFSNFDLDLSRIDFKNNQRFNTAMSYESTVLMSGINMRVPLIIDNQRNPKRIGLNELALRDIPGIKFRLSPADQNKIWETFHEDANRICRIFNLPEYQPNIQQAEIKDVWSHKTLRAVKKVLTKQPSTFIKIILNIIEDEIINPEMQLREEQKISLQQFVNSNRKVWAQMKFSSVFFLRKTIYRLKKIILLVFSVLKTEIVDNQVK